MRNLVHRSGVGTPTSTLAVLKMSNGNYLFVSVAVPPPLDFTLARITIPSREFKLSGTDGGIPLYVEQPSRPLVAPRRVNH